ncbi:MAG: HEAT repeat domain-containing protein [Acidimicrobiia bacterium]
MDPTRQALTQLTADPIPFLTDVNPLLRRMALTSLSDEQATAATSTLGTLSADEDPTVRTAAVEKLGVVGEAACPFIDTARDDPEPTVREAAATAYGEVGAPAALPWLEQAASLDPDRGVREAAVAAMGAIGDPAAVDILLGLIADGPPQVRRRAVAAITVFDDPRVEPALQRAALDRNPGVREAAEMVVGRQLR